MTVVILIVILLLVVGGLGIVVAKSIMAPHKLDNVPRLLRQGKTQTAIKMCKQIVSKEPKNFQAHYYLGKAYLKENRTELALMEYKTVNDNALFGEGIEELPFRKEYAQILLQHNQQNDALQNFLLLTKMEPNNAENFFQAGRIYELQNRYDIALGFMQKAAMLDKKHAKAHAEIGLMMYRTKQYEGAKKEIDIAIKLSPETYSSYYYLGKILKDQKDLNSAIKAFEKAQRDPEVRQKALIEHGSCFMVANRYDNAAMDFQRAIDLDKNNSNPETLFARYFLGLCYEKSRKIDDAIKQWEEIYKRNKNFRDVASKLQEYKDLQANDYLKDYLTCSNDEFPEICKNTAEKGLNMQVLTCDLKKWGCQITGVAKGDDSWMNVRKQVILIRFFRNPEPIEDAPVREAVELLKTMNAVKAFMFSSSSFTQAAKHFAENRPVELVEKQKLEAVLSKAGS
ncbi:tetratricopeptide repeat protein [Treponema sp. C6A8]|uniref:tetratricopeptide repeat protein n=1 Tax=Treponema sp. C6A8 TaxID=1410609 RepID=UPI0004807E44|nr:tetratricopeptide repeat protein [Treponema sp. C6A8]